MNLQDWPQPECEDDFAFMPNYQSREVVIPRAKAVGPPTGAVAETIHGEVQPRGATRTDSKDQG